MGDAALTLAVEFSLVLCFFLFFRLLAAQLDAEQVGVYALYRRVLALLLPLALLGLTEGLARYLAEAHAASAASRLVPAAFGGVLAGSALVALGALANPALSARLVFGDARLAPLVAPCVLFALGLVAHSFVHGVLRGLLRIKALNLLQLSNLGLVPVLVLAIARPPHLAAVLTWLGWMNAAIALGFLLAARARPGAAPAPAPIAAASLYAYSVSRLPGLLLAAALASTVPLIAKDQLPIVEVGYLSICISLLVGLGGLLSPLGTVILPHLSALVSRNETRAIERQVPLLIGAVLHLYLFVSAQLIVFADYLLEVWLGRDYLAAAPALRIAAVSLIGFGFFGATRAVLDAVSRSPINSRNAVISFGVLLVLSMLDARRVFGIDPLLYYSGVYALAGLALGALTYRSLRRIFPDAGGGDVRHLAWGLVLCCAFALLGLVAKGAVTSHWVYWLTFETLIFSAYAALIFALRFEWIKLLITRFT